MSNFNYHAYFAEMKELQKKAIQENLIIVTATQLKKLSIIESEKKKEEIEYLYHELTIS
ncbi:MAG: hypothetical protein PHG08_01010 [Bacilli bacterium]|nr:hypothetical protein [Bacilli bacterium]